LSRSSQSSSAAARENQEAQHHLRGYGYIAAACFCWGLSAALAQAVFKGRLLPEANGSAIGPLVLSQTRTTITFLLLLPLLALARVPQRAALFPERKPLVGSLLIGAFGISASNFFYYYSIQKTTVATGIILQYLCPIWVLAYMVARGLQRANATRITGVLLAVGGCALAVGIGSGALRYSSSGVAAGLAASFAFGFYNVVAQRLLVNSDRWAVIFWAIVNPPWKLVAAHFSAAQWEFLLAFAVFSVLLPYSFYFSGLKHLDATRAVVTACLEPVFAILLAIFTVGETVTALQLLGVGCVLAGTIVIQRS
jgi:drug/metabolite transporter (DMT)-like permease